MSQEGLPAARHPSTSQQQTSDDLISQANEVRLTGVFATEITMEHSDHASATSSFYICVPRMGEESDHFRVVCEGEVAEAVRTAAQRGPLKALPLKLKGRLRQGRKTNKYGKTVVDVYVLAEDIELIPWPPADPTKTTNDATQGSEAGQGLPADCSNTVQ